MVRETEEWAVGVSQSGERLFLAVALDDNARHAIAAHLDAELADRKLPGRPVPPANWHLTLRFLGKTVAQQRDQVLAYLDEHLAVAPFRISFTGLGAFPRKARASVLWMGIAGAVEQLESMAAICEAAAVAAGFEPEGRPFHAHLTLSRIRPPQDVRPLVEWVEPVGVKLDVDAVTLYRSVLGSGPARYEVVERVEL
ncbi:MAG: RNA 2',3'-cyclic phosphodiesterase [Acidimicrobiia bacterium]|nr:RNA 2',3'-cyclic phosphodiesterase [Acidimicrobiia bacterium]